MPPKKKAAAATPQTVRPLTDYAVFKAPLDSLESVSKKLQEGRWSRVSQEDIRRITAVARRCGKLVELIKNGTVEE